MLRNEQNPCKLMMHLKRIHGLKSATGKGFTTTCPGKFPSANSP